MTVKPKLSVCVVTYNQENYIRQCLQSLVDQVVDFRFEIIVGDDKSTDGTSKIVKEFSDNYPDLVFPIFHSENVGAVKNFVDVHDATSGDYIAHVDGDDFALPGKLQSQVDFLDRNPECSLVAHRMGILAGNEMRGTTRVNPKMIDMDYLLRHHPCFLNSSTVIRSDVWKSMPRLDKFLDFHVYVHACRCGEIGFQNEELGVYRQGVGISASHRLLPLVLDAIDRAAGSEDSCIASAMRYAKAKSALSYSFAFLIKREYESFLGAVEVSRQYSDGGFFPWFFYTFREHPGFLRSCVLCYKSFRRVLGG